MNIKIKKIIAWVVMILVISIFLLVAYNYSIPVFTGMCATIGIIIIGWCVIIIDPLGMRED